MVKSTYGEGSTFSVFLPLRVTQNTAAEYGAESVTTVGD
jgi:hypothetical protein